METESETKEYRYTMGTPLKRSNDDVFSPTTDNENTTSRMRECISPGAESVSVTTSLSTTDLANMKDQIMSVMLDPDVMKSIVTSVSKVLENMLLPLSKSIEKQTTSITNLTEQLTKQNQEVEALKSENKRLTNRVTLLEEKIIELETLPEKLDSLEQYSRRSSIRFVNVNKNYQLASNKQIATASPVSNIDTSPDAKDQNSRNSKVTYDEIIVDICNNKIGVEPPITEDDISRCHPIGQEKDGKLQLLCKFRNEKIKHRVFSQKRKLKNKTSDNFKVFLTEDLTPKRRRMISALNDARKDGVIFTYWTSDGRIFFKKTETSSKTEVKDFDDNEMIANMYANHNPWNKRKYVKK